MASRMDLENVAPEELAERLVEIAQQARKLADREATVELADLLADVRAAADSAGGPALALLEVAEAFLRTLSRSNLGKAEIALHRFVASKPDVALPLLGRLVDGESIGADTVGELGEIARPLVEVGALCELDGGRRFNLRPSLRNLARELVEPAPFRMWRRVEAARSTAGLNRLAPDATAAYLASQFGVTQQEAEQHLRLSPLAPASSAQSVASAMRRREWPLSYTVYRRNEPRLSNLAHLLATSDTQADVTSEPTVSGVAAHQVAPWH
jgi:hypothetical protein